MCVADPTTHTCFRSSFLLSKNPLNIQLLPHVGDRREVSQVESCHFPMVFDKLLLDNNNKFSPVTFFKKSDMYLDPAVSLLYQVIEGLFLPRAVFK